MMVMVTEYAMKSDAYGNRLCWSDGSCVDRVRWPENGYGDRLLCSE